MAIDWRTIRKSIFEKYNDSFDDPLYCKLLKDCTHRHNDSKFHSGIKLNAEIDADSSLTWKKSFIAVYLLSCEDPEKEVKRLISLDPRLERYEVLFDLIEKAYWDESLRGDIFEFTYNGWNRIKEKAGEFKPVVYRRLLCKIEEAVSVHAVEYLKGVFTADSVVDAFLHLRRRGTCLGCYVPYDELSDLLASALRSGDREETIKQFIRPLMDNLLELRDGNSHALGCAQAMLDGTKDIDGKEAKRIVREMADWKKLSSRLLCEEPAAYVEIAVEMEFDPCEVARYITDTFEGLVIEASEGRLCALSAYLLDALDADGQTRLQKIASNGNLMDRLPRGLLSHLLKDCAKLGAKHPKQAKYLNKRLNSALESKKRKFNK